jgi:hypothetical protein
MRFLGLALNKKGRILTKSCDFQGVLCSHSRASVLFMWLVLLYLRGRIWCRNRHFRGEGVGAGGGINRSHARQLESGDTAEIDLEEVGPKEIMLCGIVFRCKVGRGGVDAPGGDRSGFRIGDDPVGQGSWFPTHFAANATRMGNPASLAQNGLGRRASCQPWEYWVSSILTLNPGSCKVRECSRIRSRPTEPHCRDKIGAFKG